MANYSSSNNNSNKSKSNASKNSSTEQMKYEIASEFGVNLGADATARQNGSVGGEITRRLVAMAQNKAEDDSNNYNRNQNQSNK